MVVIRIPHSKTDQRAQERLSVCQLFSHMFVQFKVLSIIVNFDRPFKVFTSGIKIDLW